MTDFLKCRYCGFLNELEFWWRSTGDYDDTHYVICKGCKKSIWINNRDFKSGYLVEGPTTEYECARMVKMKIMRKYAVDFQSTYDLGGAINQIAFQVRDLEADLIEEREKWEEFKNEENMREFLLGREFDIANDEADLGALKNLFVTIFDRKPRDAFRCPVCNEILKDVHYTIESYYPFEGLWGICPSCKVGRTVEDSE